MTDNISNDALKTEIGGVFVKIAYADQVDILLTRNASTRPAARFNRRGESALYLSVNEQSARVAMQKHAKVSDAQRVLIHYRVSRCQLIDLRKPEAYALRQQANQDWQGAITNHVESASWKIADALRDVGGVGFIDQSRRDPDLWHVSLLRWNEVGAPDVVMVGSPTPITLNLF